MRIPPWFAMNQFANMIIEMMWMTASSLDELTKQQPQQQHSTTQCTSVASMRIQRNRNLNSQYDAIMRLL